MPTHYDDGEYKGSEHATDVFQAPKKKKTFGQELEESGQYLKDPETEVDTSQPLEYEGQEYEGQNVKSENFFLRALGYVGDTFDAIDKAAGIPGTDIDVYHARQAPIKWLDEQHFILGLLGEVFIPDTVDIASMGLAYIPNRFRKSAKVLKSYLKAKRNLMPAADKARVVKSSSRFGSGVSDLTGRPMLAQRGTFNELGDEGLEMIVKAAEPEIPLTTPQELYRKISEGELPNPTPEQLELATRFGAPDSKSIERMVPKPGGGYVSSYKPPRGRKGRAISDNFTKVTQEKLRKRWLERGWGTNADIDEFFKIQKKAKEDVENSYRFLNQLAFEFSDLANFVGQPVDEVIKTLRATPLNKGDDIFPYGPLTKRHHQKIERILAKINAQTVRAVSDGHKRAIKNIWRAGDEGGSRVTNMELEMWNNFYGFADSYMDNPVGKEILKLGNAARGARKDPSDLALLVTDVSRTVDEEFLKYMDPDIANFFDMVPKPFYDDIFGVVEDALKRKREVGIKDFNAYIEEFYGGMKAWKKVPRNVKKIIRKEFADQYHDMVPGKMQLREYQGWIREAIDDFLQDRQFHMELAAKDLGKNSYSLESLREIKSGPEGKLRKGKFYAFLHYLKNNKGNWY